jgi:hypothetical protein
MRSPWNCIDYAPRHLWCRGAERSQRSYALTSTTVRPRTFPSIAHGCSDAPHVQVNMGSAGCLWAVGDQCGLIGGNCEPAPPLVGAEYEPETTSVCKPTPHCLQAATAREGKHILQIKSGSWPYLVKRAGLEVLPRVPVQWSRFADTPPSYSALPWTTMSTTSPGWTTSPAP